jgi:hypothetical protein
MKKVLRLFAVVFAAVMMTNGAQAQLPPGSIAPDFTVTDVDGNEHTLYDILDDGKRVIIDFMATWCAPCWSYHNSGALEGVWDEMGPLGTDEVVIFMMEGDDGTTMADLEGTGGNTTGDWLSVTPWYVVDDVEWLFDEYQCTYYPTIYTICPNRMITETGQADTQTHIDFIEEAACQPASLDNDGAIIDYSGDTQTCDEAEIIVTLMNTGLTVLEAATITVSGCDNCPIEYMWEGSLDTYATEVVNVGTAQVSGSTDVTVAITSGDDDSSNDEIMTTISMATEGSTHFHIEISSDDWPYEMSWDIVDEGGSVVASGPQDGDEGVTGGLYGDGSVVAQTPISVSTDRWVDGTGCYSFIMYDGFGDGLQGSQWGSVDGSVLVVGIDADGNQMSPIWDYMGNYDYEMAEAGANVTEVVSVNESDFFTSLNIFPNPTTDVTNIALGLSASADVSIDVINMLGQTVMSQDLGTLPAGEQRTELNLSALESGMYLVNVTANGNVSTTRVTLK